MKRICAGPVTVKGIDVSHWQPRINWAAEHAAGTEFVFIKASEGIAMKDPMYGAHKRGANDAGIMTGAYHFFHPRQDPKMQAQHFVAQVGKLRTGDLPCVMDWETTDNMPSSADEQAGLVFLETVEKLTGVKPIIYSGPYFIQALSLGGLFREYPLWVAHYGTVCPLVPPPWTNWTFWQMSGKGVDRNLFNGDRAHLKALTVR